MIGKTMPSPLPTYVRTIRDDILYECAKLISRSARGELERAYVTYLFKKLRDGDISISGMIREWDQVLPPQCVFCGSTTDLITDRLIPKSRGGDDSAENKVPVCKECQSARGEKGIFEWLGLNRKDQLPRLVLGRYLVQLLKVHEAAGTLYTAKSDLGHLCSDCPLPEVCELWDSAGEMTCFCLESVLPRR